MTPVCWIFLYSTSLLVPSLTLSFSWLLSNSSRLYWVLYLRASCRKQKWKKLVCLWTHTKWCFLSPVAPCSWFLPSLGFLLLPEPKACGCAHFPLGSWLLTPWTQHFVFIPMHPLYFRHLIQLVKPLQNSNLVFQWHFKERCPFTDGF